MNRNMQIISDSDQNMKDIMENHRVDLEVFVRVPHSDEWPFVKSYICFALAAYYANKSENKNDP